MNTAAKFYASGHPGIEHTLCPFVSQWQAQSVVEFHIELIIPHWIIIKIEAAVADLIGIDETMFHLFPIVKCLMKYKDISAAIWMIHCCGTRYNRYVFDGCIRVIVWVYVSGAICVT